MKLTIFTFNMLETSNKLILENYSITAIHVFILVFSAHLTQAILRTSIGLLPPDQVVRWDSLLIDSHDRCAQELGCLRRRTGKH